MIFVSDRTILSRTKMFLCQIAWGDQDPNWDDKGLVEVFTFEEFNKVLDEIEKQHQGDKSTIVAIYIPSREALFAGLGLSNTLLIFASRNDDSYSCMSVGNKDDETEETVMFYFGNTRSEYLKRNLLKNKRDMPSNILCKLENCWMRLLGSKKC